MIIDGAAAAAATHCSKFLVQRNVAHPWTLGKKGFIWELGFLGEPLVI